MQCVQAIYNCRRPALSWRNTDKDIVGYTKKGIPVFDCEFMLYDSTMGSGKALANKGKKSYREYYREHVHVQSMNLIKKQEPLEGFKDWKAKPRASMPDEDDEEVPDT